MFYLFNLTRVFVCQVVYCAVCCEPFHDFCLEEAERPAPNASEWVCRNCRFCYVCGKLDELLACDLCQKTYHPACLGDGFNADSPPGKWVGEALNQNFVILGFMLRYPQSEPSMNRPQTHDLTRSSRVLQPLCCPFIFPPNLSTVSNFQMR